MAKVTAICDHCGTSFERETGHINRSRAIGASVYCSQTCSGLARRIDKSLEQKRAEKREYDKRYRADNKEMLKVKKAAYFHRTYDPEKARVERKKRSAAHAEYCRRPEYKRWKQAYDRTYRAKKRYGDYWECFLLTLDIRNECLTRSTAYEIRKANQTLVKVQKRKRDANTHR